MEKDVQRVLPLGWRDFLDTPVTEEELKAAVSKGACNKAPGRNGICLNFFKVNLENMKDGMQAIFNQMYLDGWNMERQAHGIVVRITRPDLSTTPADYEPITWLNTDYKTQAPIRTNRLRPTFFDILRPSHYFGAPGTTIFGAVTTVRKGIAYAGLTHAALCTLCLQFSAAFHKIFLTYLLRMIKSYGYSMKFITFIQTVLCKSSFSVQINGYFFGPFPHDMPLHKTVQ
jgi:hypothetical protein